jgi:RsiW-degrading membrane proteinase PrsW (M82 family)
VAELQDIITATTFHRPGLREKLFFLVSGMIMSIPFTLFVERLSAYFLSIRLLEFYAATFSTAIIAPVVEEFAKAYPLFYRHGETEKSLFTLGFLVGLGFGFIEFLIYIFVYAAPVLIRLPALLFHATNTSITAYGISTRRTARFYLVAVFLHSLNNFSAQLGLFWFVGGVAAIAGSYLLSWRLHRKTSG